MAERLKAVVLKTTEVHASGGSNPSPSATFQAVPFLSVTFPHSIPHKLGRFGFPIHRAWIVPRFRLGLDLLAEARGIFAGSGCPSR